MRCIFGSSLALLYICNLLPSLRGDIMKSEATNLLCRIWAPQSTGSCSSWRGYVWMQNSFLGPKQDIKLFLLIGTWVLPPGTWFDRAVNHFFSFEDAEMDPGLKTTGSQPVSKNSCLGLKSEFPFCYMKVQGNSSSLLSWGWCCLVLRFSVLSSVCTSDSHILRGIALPLNNMGIPFFCGYWQLLVALSLLSLSGNCENVHKRNAVFTICESKAFKLLEVRASRR